jgi:hypothetical protein
MSWRAFYSTTMTTPQKGSPTSAQPMKCLSARAQKLLQPAKSQISIGKRYQGEIPNAFKSSRKETE